VETVEKLRVERCEHVIGHVSYVRNDPGHPPVLLVENLPEVNVVVLTNQVIRIWCPACYAWQRVLSPQPVDNQ